MIALGAAGMSGPFAIASTSACGSRATSSVASSFHALSTVGLETQRFTPLGIAGTAHSIVFGACVRSAVSPPGATPYA